MKGDDFFLIGVGVLVCLIGFGDFGLVLVSFFCVFVNNKLMIGDFLGMNLFVIFFFLISKRELVFE